MEIKVGDHGYLRQFTGHDCADDVKDPVTVVAVDKQKKTITVQHAKLIWPIYHCTGNPHLDRPDLEGQRVYFYDTVAESIEEDPEGELETLSWHSRRGLYGTEGISDKDYPQYLITSEGFQHFPYLD